MQYQAPAQLLKDKIILITGAGDGIGKTAARTFAGYGATVILLGRTIHKLEQVYDDIIKDGSPEPAIYPMNLEGATPKDGPSAGVGMCTALVSALTEIPVKADVAMTGEITLRGEVLPIGGLKEKLLAAHRGGVKLVIIPEENEKDLVDIPKNIQQNLEIKPVKWIDEVLELALTHLPEPRKTKSSTSKKSRTTRKKTRSVVRH